MHKASEGEKVRVSVVMDKFARRFGKYFAAITKSQSSISTEAKVLRLPEYEVVVHVIVSKFSADLIKEIEDISKDFELDEMSEFNGVRDYHWEFPSWDEAVAAGDRLKHLVPNPNLRMLRVKTNYDSSIKAISHKDLVRPQNQH